MYVKQYFHRLIKPDKIFLDSDLDMPYKIIFMVKFFALIVKWFHSHLLFSTITFVITPFFKID